MPTLQILARGPWQLPDHSQPPFNDLDPNWTARQQLAYLLYVHLEQEIVDVFNRFDYDFKTKHVTWEPIKLSGYSHNASDIKLRVVIKWTQRLETNRAEIIRLLAESIGPFARNHPWEGVNLPIIELEVIYNHGDGVLVQPHSGDIIDSWSSEPAPQHSNMVT